MLVIINRQPNANIIETVDRVTALLPALRASIPSAIDVTVAMERTTTIRASLRDVERALAIAVGARDPGRVPVPAQRPRDADPERGGAGVAGRHVRRHVPRAASRLNNLSLMALTIATGFVVDDAIVVLENTIAPHRARHDAVSRRRCSGAREVGFTVLSMSVSLIAVFIPILLMGGIVGRLFREFAVTLSVAILVSLVVSLTTTPMMCARLLRPQAERAAGPLRRAARARVRGGAARLSARALAWSAAPRPARDARAARRRSASTSTST